VIAAINEKRFNQTTIMKINFRMKMSFKSLLTIVLITFLITTSNKIYAQTKVGIQSGYNISNVLMKDRDGIKSSTKSISGIHVGLNIDLPVTPNFYIQPGIEYIEKGFRQNDNYFFGNGNETKVKVAYVQFPLSFIYQLGIHSEKLYIGAGPYVSYGTGGKWKSKSDVVIGDIKIENHGNVNFKNDFMDRSFGEYTYGKPWEFGYNLLLGYRFINQLSFQINNQTGISNLRPKVGGSSEGGVLKNRVWSFSLGYTF
jgi:hypothetical protein